MILSKKSKSSTTLEHKKIYDDNELFKHRDNKLNIILKYSILSVLFILVFISLIFSPITFFGVDSNTLKFVWIYQKDLHISLNFLNIWRFLILSFCIIYPLVKNFFNIFFQKELIKKYTVFFFIYLAISLSSFFLFVFYNPVYYDVFGQQSETQNAAIIHSSSVFYISILLLFIVLTNTAYHLFLFYFKRKTETLKFNKKSVLIINIVSQFIFVILFLIFIYNITKTQPAKFDDTGQLIANEEYIATQNSWYLYIKNLFEADNIGNIFIIIILIILISVIFFGSNLIKIFFVFSKEYNRTYFKNQIQVLFVILASCFLWYLIILTRLGNFSSLGISTFCALHFVPFVIVLLAILAAYLFVNLYSKIKIQGNGFNLVMFIVSQLLIVFIFLIATLFLSNELSIRIIFFLSSLVSWIITTFFFVRNKKPKLVSMLFISTYLILFALAIVLQGWEILLLSVYNFATVAFTPATHLSLIQIIFLIQVALLLALMVYTITDVVVAMFKINKMKQPIDKGVSHEK